MKSYCAVALVIGNLFVAPTPALGQFAGFALYEVGAATTDLGSEEGTSKLVYGFGAGASYEFMPERDLGIVVGADLVVRGFGMEIPDRLELNVGVFNQTDLWIDEFVALRFQRVLAVSISNSAISAGIEPGPSDFRLREWGCW